MKRNNTKKISLALASAAFFAACGGFALKNNVTGTGITESREYVTTAINILANKAVNYANFSFHTHGEEELPAALEEFSKSPTDRAVLSEEIHLFKFVL